MRWHGADDSSPPTASPSRPRSATIGIVAPQRPCVCFPAFVIAREEERMAPPGYSLETLERFVGTELGVSDWF